MSHSRVLHRAENPRRLATLVAVFAAIVAAGLAIYALSAGATGSRYAWDPATGFPTPRVPANNPMSTGKVLVGRRLFYDTRLSGNQTQSCSSCHRQELAFTDGRAQAIGSTGQLHPRGAQSLVNVAYDSTLTWANPALTTLERQMEVPLFGTNPVEMGITDANKAQILARIRRDPWYARNFPRAFPRLERPITYTTIIRAIASFQRSIVAADSRYDRYLRNKATLTAPEKRGLNLFMGEKAECQHCHGSFIFNDQVSHVGLNATRPLFHNTGLYNVGGSGAFPAPNRGVFEITGRPQDMGRFKAPTLRNVALTGPYMHDGTIPTLEAAVDHYAAGGRNITEGPLAGDGRVNPYKDPLLAAIRLSPAERADIVAFLKTLTDRTLIGDRRFADPFARKRARGTETGPRKHE